MKNLLKKYSLSKGHREYYFVIALGIALVIIIFLIVIISFQASSTTTPPTRPIIYSPNPTAVPLTTPSSVPHTNPPLLRNINIQAASELVTREEHRTPLSQSNAQAKTNILKLLPSGQIYGTVYSSNNIDIEYVQALDLFDVYILTIDVASIQTRKQKIGLNSRV